MGADESYFHDLFFFSLSELDNFCNCLVSELLDLVLSYLELVLGDFAVLLKLLELIDSITSNVSYCYL